MLRSFLDREFRDRMIEARQKNKETLTPVRLQAYERLTLFLERISPNHLLMRTAQGNKSANDLRQELLRNIREEFEHNLTQQIYVSNNAWEMVKKAKEEMVKVINTEAEQLPSDASAIDLSKQIFKRCSQMERLPTQVASTQLKSEARKLFE